MSMRLQSPRAHWLLLAILLILQSVQPSALRAQDPDLRRLDAFIAQAQREWPVPGLAVVVVKDGRPVLLKGYGVRESGGDEPVDEHTLFAIASNTKAFTSAALAMLVEEGEVSWDDPVRQHLPYFQLYDPFVSQEMRVRDLLCHRSGLGTFSGDLLWYGTGYPAAEVVGRARHLPAAGPFRASYGYSNLMFIAAGEVVAAASGVPWAEFVRRRILEPLEMERTVVSVSSLDRVDNVATPHKNRRDGVHPIAWYNWDAMAAAGGIISSVSEMGRWLELQLNHGELDGERLFTEESSWEMWSLHTPMRLPAASRTGDASTHFRGYGLGWNLSEDRGRLVVSHGGGYDGMFSQVVLVPEEGLGMAVLTNSMTGVGTVITDAVLDAYLGGGPERSRSGEMLQRFRTSLEELETRQGRFLAERLEGTSPSLPLAGYAGTYGGPMYGDATVTVEDGRLVLRLLPNPDLVADLAHLHHDTFLVEWRDTFAWFGTGAATFLLDPYGEATELRLDVPNDDLWFHELELKRR